MTKLAIVVSVYNEESVLFNFWNSLKTSIEKINGYSIHVIFVNDGSKDKSQEVIEKIISENKSGVYLTSIKFSRNFGHEAAMTAGIDFSNEDALICMDADLQHPPEKILEMLDEFQKGNEIVLMSRIKRHDNGIVKNILSSMFYKTFEQLSVHKFERNASDFFLISRKVADILKVNFRERNRFLRGFIQIIGFNISTLYFEAPARNAGKTSYSIRGLLKLSFTAIFAFSNKPLKISLIFSLLFLFFATAVVIYSIIIYFFGEKPPSGYTTLIIFQSIGFTVLSFMISVLSMYFGRSLEEIRDRPIYLIELVINSSQTN